ncbi:hypothetical protein [Halococcoides cellulosivorans]|uniref:Uncharacterized protein n=1 Tax=Halococcoides cellulosivorans TaxID=1679096 RepID=A0A2R4WZM9_9EURY|nr:hypothetical protein [Halococcoides cellulosivorans]AWB26984.1 hypothetical protein HARCEL1_04285 [Halococcoides cellulosivorans]
MTRRVLAHLAQPDHATFVIALAIAAVEAVRTRRRSAIAITLLLAVALVYDAWEFLTADGPT